MSKQPELILSAHDLNQIEALIEKSNLAEKLVAELETELARATVVKHHDVPKDRVAMGSQVTFRIDDAEKEFTKTLCFPDELKEHEDGISIFAPIGSALIGLAVGQVITWPGTRGEQRVKIIGVKPKVTENGVG
ncbi:nucleoside diphosphate kinase regulator [Aliidiomarina quisquiliarum]|uniref:nucleoside diphosphate kinase regulator n=1 Tax=Aliidiomarina quisquiliarum TaxID=2938947 RepID=UPI00208F5D94|nr:nucleoside diphosphate kinase regulator [Aliidiomarina quisquiliarum]MCO4320542.1 nucleoside diphosphate kinase regulator [Aliidiomarina quisquiliarum]